jgi:hypothetical protein
MRRSPFFVFGSTSVIIVLLVLMMGNTVASVTVPPWGNTIGHERSAEVAGDTVVGQQFVAPFPGLYQIELGLDRALVRSTHRLTFHLKEGDSLAAEGLWKADLSTDDIRDGEPHTFEFPTIRDSAGQTYYFYLQSTDSLPGDAITVRYDPASLLDGSSAFVDGQAVNGNLQFQTFYALTAGDKVDILLTRMSEGRPYLLGAKGFYLGLAVAYLLVLGIFLWQIAQAILEEERA